MKFLARNGAKRKSIGFTLIELMVAVTIIAIAIIALLGRYSSTKLATQIQQETSNIQSIVAATQSAFMGQPSYINLTTAVMVAANGFPTQMNVGGVISNVWAGGVTMGPSQLPAVNNAKAQIDYTLVPIPACIGLVNAVASTVDSVYVGGTSVKASGADLTTPAAIQAACGAAPSTVKIIFTS